MHRALPRVLSSSLLAAALTSGCASGQPPALVTSPAPTSQTHDALLVSLDGPHDDVAAALQGRIERSEDCDLADAPGAPRASAFLDEVLDDAPLLDAQLWAYGSDNACAPITLCTLAVRTPAGWWLSPSSEDRVCEGATGPSSRVRVLSEVLERGERGEVLVRRVLAREMTSYGSDPDSGERVERSELGLAAESFACAASADGAPRCQRVVNANELTMDLEGLLEDARR